MSYFGLAGRKVHWSLTWRAVLAVTVAALAGMAFGRNVLGTVSVVNGPSMLPTYAPGTHLLTLPVVSPISRGDVVILDDGSEKYAVKRVIGLPGETVQIWRGQVFINGRRLLEPYLPKHVYTCPVDGHRVSERLVAREGQYVVMGDNRACSSDSRVYGPVDEHQIKRHVPLPSHFTRPELEDKVTELPLPTPLQADVAKQDGFSLVSGR